MQIICLTNLRIRELRRRYELIYEAVMSRMPYTLHSAHFGLVQSWAADPSLNVHAAVTALANFSLSSPLHMHISQSSVAFGI
jgi:hypothetical protein